MRLSVASLRQMVKRPLHVEFTRQQLTSYSGLDLLRRYLRQLDLPQRLRAACAATGGDWKDPSYYPAVPSSSIPASTYGASRLRALPKMASAASWAPRSRPW